MSYKKLEIRKLSRGVAIEIHKMSMQLSKFELYETGSQIRRSSKSIRANIVEGYGRKRYKQDYITLRMSLFKIRIVIMSVMKRSGMKSNGLLGRFC